MDRRATLILLGIGSIVFSLSGCASNRRLMEIEARAKPDDKVIIGVRPDGSGGGRIVVVHPPSKEACRPERTDCGEKVRWQLVGSIGDWKVQVKEKTGGTDNCFTPFTLHKNHREELQAPSAKCQQDGSVWFYDVVLTDATDRELHRVDPLVFVNYSPGP
jgi:hypothetical protein